MNPVEVIRGEAPLILAQPHGGTFLPEPVLAALNPAGRALADTDWHIGRLYEGLAPGVTVVRANFHRYVIDANRDPSGASLYPGQNTTGLVPETDFDGAPIWSDPPDAAQTEARRVAFHSPYHAALTAEIDRLRERHGAVIVWDCHSIRSRIPFLFPGTLPDLSIGTYDGASCAPEVEVLVAELCSGAPYSSVLNGRFKGGWTTRHYGRPGRGVHAVQMELAQLAYLTAEAPPWNLDPDKAAKLGQTLAPILGRLIALIPSLRGTP